MRHMAAVCARCYCPDHQCSAACLQTLSPDKAEMQKCTGAQVRQLLGIRRGGQEALIALALLTGRPAVQTQPPLCLAAAPVTSEECGSWQSPLALLTNEADYGELAPANKHVCPMHGCDASLQGEPQPW